MDQPTLVLRRICAPITVLLIALWTSGALWGCATSGPAARGVAGGPASIEQDVRFLAQPALDGRKPKSVGSMEARRYIARRFKACGLVPWGEAQGYAQPVKLGTNVVGVLPGQDPALANEIVLVSAHYDHVGGGRLGAADNAAGVGILLEVVRRMAQAPGANKRTVCFAAFDCEETALWGSLVFMRRPDVNPASIVAVVNVDTVGRRAFDCMDDTLFVGRSHAFPSLMDAISAAAEAARLRVLPCALLLPGPRGDYVPFSAQGVPSLFFSTGPFADYHTKMDTVQRLDWGLVQGTCDEVCEATRWLATAPALSAGTPERLGSRDDLLTVRAVLEAQLGTLGSRTEKGPAEDKIRACVAAINETLASESFTTRQAYGLLQDAFLAMGPQLATLLGAPASKGEAGIDEADVRVMTICLLFYERHQADIMELYGRVADILMGRSGLPPPDDSAPPIPELRSIVKKRKFRTYLTPELVLISNPLLDEEVVIAESEDGQRHLGVLFPEIRICLWNLKNPFAASHGVAAMKWSAYTCRGDTDTLIDYCLLQWECGTSMSLPWEDMKKRGKAWSRVLQRIAPGRPIFETWEESVAYRLEETGCASMGQWMLGTLRKKNPHMLRQAICSAVGPATGEVLEAIRGILFDASLPADIRARALTSYFQVTGEESVHFDGQVLRDLAALTSDPTPIPTSFGVGESDFPDSLVLASFLVKACRRSADTSSDDAPQRTIGDAARTRLAELAAATGVQDIANAPDGVTLRGPCRLTAFPRGLIRIGCVDEDGAALGIAIEDDSRMVNSDWPPALKL